MDKVETRLDTEMDKEAYLDAEWRSMRRRIVGSVGARQSEMAESVLTLPVSNYTDQARFEAERNILFRTTPLLVGFSKELAEPGDVMLFEAAGPSILIVRAQDGSLNAFLNACPHRGAKLVESSGRKAKFTCPYHAWTFAHDGKIIAQPEAACFEGARNSLTPVPVAEKYGMVFVRATPNGEEIDVDAFLGDIAPLLSAFRLDEADFAAETLYTWDANWKVALDTACEGYHVPTIHQKSLLSQLVPYITIHDSFGLHHRYCVPERPYLKAVGVPEEEWADTSYSAVHYLFPNIILTVTKTMNGTSPVTSIVRFFPGSHIGEVLMSQKMYKPAGVEESLDHYVGMNDLGVWMNKEEDLPVARGVWYNYRHMDPNTRATYGKNEMVLQRYHQQIADVIGMPLE